MRATCEAIGLAFDPWQMGAGRCVLGKDASGLYAADTVGLSIGRQVGKTFFVGLLVFADSIIHPGTTTVWTAHRFKVARETFNELRGIAVSPKLAAHINPDDIYTAAGNESITFLNGSRIVFAARERGSIRGFTKVRRLVLDEAQILTEAVMADLAPTQNQAWNPQTILMGTPPKPTDPGEVFTQLRAEALEGSSDGVVWLELAASPDCDIDDLEAWEEANPSLHTRTPVRAIRRLRKLLTAEDFAREALGIWPPGTSVTVIPMRHWDTLADTNPPKATEVGLAIDVTPARSSGSVCFAGRRPDGLVEIEVIANKLGTGWIVDLVVERRVQRPDAPVMLDASGPAGSLIADLEKVGIDKDHGLIVCGASDMAKACGAFYDAAMGTPDQEDGTKAIPPVLRHQDQPVLNAALAGAKKRKLAEAWAWARAGDVDISPLVAATLALAALERAPKKKRTGKVVCL